LGKIQFHLGDIEPRLTERAGQLSPSLVAKRDLQRYYQILNDSMPRLTEGAAAAICDALNGAMLTPATYRYLWAEVDDWPAEELGTKWGIDGPALVTQLRALSPCASMALCDAVERFWAAREGRDRRDVLIEVGLIEA